MLTMLIIQSIVLLSIIFYLSYNIAQFLEERKFLKNKIYYNITDNIFRDSNLKAVNALLDLLREKLNSSDLYPHNRKYILASLVNLKESFFKYKIGYLPNYQIIQDLNLKEHRYIHPERIVEIILKLIENNPSTNEDMKPYFELNDDNFRKYIFMKTKEFIELVNKYDDRKMLFLYTEHSLVEETKKLFEAENIKIQFAGDEIIGDGTSVCYYI